MAQPLVDLVLSNARAIIANRRLRLLGAEAVTADGREPEYRLALARDGYALVKCDEAVFKPEG
jgi:hypothetical protein